MLSISPRYRKVPGDQCDSTVAGSVSKNTEASTKDTGQVCDEGDPDTYLDLQTVKNVSHQCHTISFHVISFSVSNLT